MGHNYTYARHHGLPKWERTSLLDNYTVLVKSFAHLNRNFFLASLEEIGKPIVNPMFKVSPPLSGGSQKIHSIKCVKLLTGTVG